MKAELKPLAEQTIVITGATSGHGLATAKQAAAAGARVLLVARDAEALAKVQGEIRADGGVAETVSADVGVEEDIDRVVDLAVKRLGGFDTWVNNAGIGVYGDALEASTEDHRRVFDTNYWGVVYGSLAAVRHLKEKPGGGALVNVGSINSDIPGPLLSSYNASKHAVKGFTDSLRIEMLAADAPVSVTLIKPSAIGTPFPEHGRNLTGHQATLPPPIYAPGLVADAILDAAQHPRRSITVGGAGQFQILGSILFPWLFDRIASRMGGALIDTSKPIPRQDGNLHEPQGDDGRIEGRQRGRGFSVYTAAQTHPAQAFGAFALLGATGLGALLLARRRSA